MKLINVLSAISLLLLVFHGQICSGLDLESAKEQPCFNITKDQLVPMDVNFVATIKALYYPLTNRYLRYHIASDLTMENFKEISESDLYYDSCMYWNMYTNGSIISRGFNGLSREYYAKPQTPNMEIVEISSADGQGYKTTAYSTFTDNKTFFFNPFCLSNGEMAFALASITPALPRATMEKVKEHAISLGFKKEYFSELRFHGCNLENV